MASPGKVRDFRVVTNTTFSTTFDNAAGASWAAGTATKLRIQSVDHSGLTYESAADETLESQRLRGRRNIPTLRKGNVKFSCFLDGAETNVDPGAVCQLIGDIMGGVKNPGSARTDAAEAGGSGTLLKITSHGVSTGTAVLVGSRGDAKGEAEVRSVVATNVDALTATMAFSGTPAATDAVVFSSTCFYNAEATQKYIHGLSIGHDATDQIQWISGIGPFAINGTVPGEIPVVEFDIQVADWQSVASASRDQLEPTSAPSGNQPALTRGMGGFFLGDNGSTTRTVFKVAELSINPGVTFEPCPDLNGINGVGGWVRVPSVPTAEFTIILDGAADPWPGLYDDFVAGTAKQLMIQFGNTAANTIAFEFPEFYLDQAPITTEVNGLAAVKIMGHGTEAAHAAGEAGSLQYSGLKIHFF